MNFEILNPHININCAINICVKYLLKRRHFNIKVLNIGTIYEQ